MFCEKCGAALPDGAPFCGNCGAAQQMNAQQPIAQQPVQDYIPQQAAEEYVPEQIAQEYVPQQQEYVPQQEYIPTEPAPRKEKPPKQPKPPKKKMAKWKKILLLTGIALVILGALAGYLYLRWYNSDEQVALRAVEKEDYEQAIELIDGKYDSKEGKALLESMREKITGAKDGFLSEELSYQAAKKAISDLRAYDVAELRSELDEADRYLDDLNTSRTCFDTAEEHFAAGNYEKAMAAYRGVIETDPNYSQAQTQLEAAITAYREEMLAQAAEKAEKKEYADAIAILDNALRVLPGDSALQTQRELYAAEGAAKDRSDTLKDAADSAAKGDYAAAMSLIKALLADNADDAELKAAYKKYYDKYIEQVLAEVDEKLAAKDYTGAAAAINAGLRVAENDAKLLAKRDEIEASKPVSLSEELIINSRDWPTWNKGTPVDPFGNDYSGAFNYVIFDFNRGYSSSEITFYVEYRTYGKYTSLEGRIGPYTTMDTNGQCYLQVYTDDQLKFTSPTVYRKTDAFPINVDITGAEYVKLVFVCPKDQSYRTIGAILSNLAFVP